MRQLRRNCVRNPNVYVAFVLEDVYPVSPFDNTSQQLAIAHMGDGWLLGLNVCGLLVRGGRDGP